MHLSNYELCEWNATHGVVEKAMLTLVPSRSYGLEVVVVPLQQRAGVVSSSRIRDSVDVESLSRGVLR